MAMTTIKILTFTVTYSESVSKPYIPFSNRLLANRISSDITSKKAAHNSLCLVRPIGGFQQVRAAMKGSDISSIHERLVATYGDGNASLSLY